MLVGESGADSLGIDHLRWAIAADAATRPNHRDSPSPTRSQADRALIAWGLRPVWSSRSLSPVTIASALDSRAKCNEVIIRCISQDRLGIGGVGERDSDGGEGVHYDALIEKLKRLHRGRNPDNTIGAKSVRYPSARPIIMDATDGSYSRVSSLRS
jgi:hypothetical protein